MRDSVQLRRRVIGAICSTARMQSRHVKTVLHLARSALQQRGSALQLQPQRGAAAGAMRKWARHAH